MLFDCTVFVTVTIMFVMCYTCMNGGVGVAALICKVLKGLLSCCFFSITSQVPFD